MDNSGEDKKQRIAISPGNPSRGRHIRVVSIANKSLFTLLCFPTLLHWAMKSRLTGSVRFGRRRKKGIPKAITKGMNKIMI